MSTSYNPARDTIVRRALRMVGAFNSGDAPRPEQLADAVDVLNMMIKAMQIEGHLWVKIFAELTLTAGQASYSIGGNSACVTQGTSTAAARPFRIYGINRKATTGGNEVPLLELSRKSWMEVPTKSSTGTPVQYYYDPQMTTGKLYIWPAPIDTTYKLILSMDRPLTDILDDTETYDFPQEWLELLCYGLAWRLSPEYGMSIAERQQLGTEYATLRDIILSGDTESNSVYFEMEGK
mgnify:CR=1 FL=1